MKISVILRMAMLVSCAVVTRIALAALTVTTPSTGSSVISAGNDYATQVIGDAWDMNNVQDIDMDESVGESSQGVSGGVFSIVDGSSGCNTGFFPLFRGYGSHTVVTARGPQYPINTSIYRYLTMKIRATGGAATQTTQILFFQNGDGTGAASSYADNQSLIPNQWMYLTWDLYTQTSSVPWTTLPRVEGIEIVPCNGGSANIQIDWIRLTAPSSSGQSFNVTWTDTGSNSTYTITAIDADATRYQFASGVSGMAYSADFSRLAAGDYQIEVKRADSVTALGAGVVHVNSAPQVNISAPSVRGEQSKSYAVTQLGGQWAVPMSDADFKSILNFNSHTYSNPLFPGSFYGRPTNFDPGFLMKTTGHPIDASLYRSLCFTQEVFGTRSIGGGSVARLLWGPNVNTIGVSTSADIILGNGLVEYCVPDLADMSAVPLESGSPTPWAGTINYFRMDPDEWPTGGCNTPETCHDVRLDSIILAPFAAAKPAYPIHLTVTDPDYAAGGAIQIYLDPDKTFGNGNEIGVATVPYTIGTFTLVADQNIPNGTYYLAVLADDGRNSVAQYAGGKIVTDNADVIFRNGLEFWQ